MGERCQCAGIHLTVPLQAFEGERSICKESPSLAQWPPGKQAPCSLHVPMKRPYEISGVKEVDEV